MKLHSLHTGNFKLDGGAMFGVVPKALWQRTNPADETNRCTWAMRSLLIEDGDRLILVDTGMGTKQSEKFFSHYSPHGPESTDGSLEALGFTRDDITDVFLTHLHFDHCGGAIEWNADRSAYQPAFRNARFWSNERHWKWATEPNARESASFLTENLLPLQESGRLEFIDAPDRPLRVPTPLGFDMFVVDGHTEAQMCPIIPYKNRVVVFMADLLPSVSHIPRPYIMSYDIRPLVTLEERALIFSEAADEGYYLFLEHNPTHEVCRLQHSNKGPQMKDAGSLAHYFG